MKLAWLSSLSDRLIATRPGSRHALLPHGVVAAHLVQHPRADVEDEARFLRERDELRRGDVAVTRQAPAQQRLGADDLAARQVDLGLVADEELVAVERASQLALEHEPLDGGGVHLGRVVHVTVTAGALGVVHRRVRVADQVDDVVGVLRAGRDADARRDLHLVVADVQGPRDLPSTSRASELACSMPVRRVVATLGEDRELVAGQAADHRFARQDRASAARSRFRGCGRPPRDRTCR